MHSPRILIAAPSSGCGKTTVTCGILTALVRRGRKVASFKCGPDYIDPMFHEKVLGIPSGTLDSFFMDEDNLKRAYIRRAKEADLTVTEGVMGYYDGMGATETASTYEIASRLGMPVILVINARGKALSALAEIRGFMGFRRDSGICGVIFNRMSEAVFQMLKPEVEKLGIVPLGFLPDMKDIEIKSRNLGLITPDEAEDTEKKLGILADMTEKMIDLEALTALAEQAEDITEPCDREIKKLPKTCIALARDEAFCFIYRDNTELLESCGADIVYFSPLHDERLPECAKGLILPGGYPELYAKGLSENRSMLSSVKKAINDGMPCLAECGGFMYLHSSIKTADGKCYPMCGIFSENTYATGKLQRFGYVDVIAGRDSAFLREGERIRAHEFHYYDSENCGSSCVAKKPASGRSWECMRAEGNVLCGFPHMYYPSCRIVAERFLLCSSGRK